MLFMLIFCQNMMIIINALYSDKFFFFANGQIEWNVECQENNVKMHILKIALVFCMACKIQFLFFFWGEI